MNSLSSDAFLRYWRNSLADAELRQPAVDDDAWRLNKQSSFDALRSGEFPVELVEEIFDAARKQASKRAGGKVEKIEEVDLLITPFRLRAVFEHASPWMSEQIHAPVWIHASLDSGGTLSGRDVWIARGHLAPVEDEVPVLGPVDAYDEYLTKTSGAPNDWEALWAYLCRLLDAVTSGDLGGGESFENLPIEGYAALPPAMLLNSPDRGAGQRIRRLYEELLDRKKIFGDDRLPPLLERFAHAMVMQRPVPKLGEPMLRSRRHRGQMAGSFPLSPSQRRATSAALDLADGEILAVNGPPGTGKTTLLQSLVASAWVDAALTENPSPPPVIVACSTNNQAVTNILDSFDRVAREATGPLGKRWLPEVDSYGLFLPSGKMFESTTYQSARPGWQEWDGLPARMEDIGFVGRAEGEYLAKAREALGVSFASVAGVVGHLRKELSKVRDRHDELLEDAVRVIEIRRARGVSTAAEVLAASVARRDALQKEIDGIESLRREALEVVATNPLLELLFDFIPAVRRSRIHRLEMPFVLRRVEPPDFSGDTSPRHVAAHCDALVAARQEEIDRVAGWIWREERFANGLAGLVWDDPKAKSEIPPIVDDPVRVQEALDTSLRYRMFQLAARYWEGRWLLETRALIEADPKKYRFRWSAERCLRRFRRFAMLTPCMVSTFYIAPMIFTKKEDNRYKPMLEAIDLLIVDEAGQVTPEVGAATFALAKRAVLVGDVHQIEPVWGVTPGVDLGNLQNVGLTLEEAQKDKHLPYRASCGSLMQMARRATSVSDGSGGILLTEHRRSVPEIIDYCNRLVYGGRLQPLRPEFDGERVLPAMGWAHITSPTKRRGGSWLNPGEAKVIAEWIGSMRQDLETRYEQSIGEILGVVTPFAAQKWVLINALRDAGLKDVQAGTVHTFQGAERPVILFSSVYSAKSEASSYFFDSGPNMLNVAVSRARDSFLAFGDMRIFRVGGSTPSALLAEHLFASPDNEIVNVESAQHFFGLGEEVRRISGLDDHRRVLDSALATSRERVLIVSPYLTRKAVEADEVMEKVRAATARGVEVRIAWCPGLNQNPGRAKTAHQAVDLLKNAGAVVHGLGQIHSKTLVVDKRWIVEGSFNWLSASRRKGGVWQNHEASLGCSGEGAGELIREAWEEIEAAAKGSLTDR